MHKLQFDSMVNVTIQETLAVLTQKNEGYASEDDQLSNFRTAAKLQSCSVSQAVAGMMAKHTVSVYDMVSSGKRFSAEEWDEKIGDHLNYLLLLKAALIGDGVYDEITAEASLSNGA